MPTACPPPRGPSPLPSGPTVEATLLHRFPSPFSSPSHRSQTSPFSFPAACHQTSSTCSLPSWLTSPPSSLPPSQELGTQAHTPPLSCSSHPTLGQPLHPPSPCRTNWQAVFRRLCESCCLSPPPPYPHLYPSQSSIRVVQEETPSSISLPGRTIKQKSMGVGCPLLTLAPRISRASSPTKASLGLV